MKLSVCVDAVFMKQDMEYAIKKVSELGIDAIEFWTWEDKDIDKIKRIKEETGIEVSAFCTGNISLVDASKREEYITSLINTIEIAKKLECKTLITQTGAELDISRAEQHVSLVEGLKSCVPYLQEAGITLVVEPLNTRVDHQGYYLSSSDEAAEVMKEVGSDYVKILYDVYHQQITEGDLIRRIKEYMPLFGHIHVAGNPGRHELYTSEIDYEKIFSVIKETGYDGFVGLEYFPADNVEKGMEYAKKIFMNARNS